jgi:hypothetical protein
VYGVHGAITGNLPPQCDFKLGNRELETHTFLALSVSIKLIDSSLLQLKKCYYFTFMPQDSMHLMEEVSGQGSRNYYLFGFFLPQGETVQKFLAQPSRQAAVLRINDILVWIRIRESMPPSRGQQKIIFCAYYFLKAHLHYFSKIKSKKEVTNQ